MSAITTITTQSTPSSTVAPVTPSSMKLEEATEKMLEVLTTKGFSFSAHDVTQLLREAVNLRGLELDGKLKDYPAQIGAITALTMEVNHQEVKELIHNTFELGKFPAYTWAWKKSDRPGGGRYRHYTPNVPNTLGNPSVLALKNPAT